MQKLKYLIPFLLVIFTLSGCYGHTYRTGRQAAQPTPNYEAWQHHIIGGLFNLSDDTHVDQICPNGAAVLHNRSAFLNVVVSSLTMGIYTPTTVKIWCATSRGEMGELEVDEDSERADDNKEKSDRDLLSLQN